MLSHNGEGDRKSSIEQSNYTAMSSGSEVDQPFVRSVYQLIGVGDLDPCESMLRDLLNDVPESMKAVVDRMDPDSAFPGYYDWLVLSCRGRALDSNSALAVDLGDFEINSGNLWMGVTLSENYSLGKATNDYEWLCESDSSYIGDVYRLKDSDLLLISLDMALGLRLTEEHFTAYCYLVFVLLAKATEDAHRKAKLERLPFGSANFFCGYGDCLHRSAP